MLSFATLLKAVKLCRVNHLRNEVVHKQAYRPTAEEARGCHEEAVNVLPELTRVIKSRRC